ncbi:MAG: putative secreted protein [Frondihabitans sp.]|nr:putative secreted protein [Frondihabitans sp.]
MDKSQNVNEATTTGISRRRLLAGSAGVAGTAAAAGLVWSGSPASAASRHPLPPQRGGRPSPILDSVVLGNSASETAHALVSTLSSVVAGQQSQPARVLNPASPAAYWGGTVKFTLRVSPDKTTYVTTKFWGGDAAPDENDGNWRLNYFINDKILGYLDQGEIDNADMMDQDPRSPERFFLHTLPIPESVTRGLTTLEIEIRSNGSIFAYGDATNFFSNQTTPSRSIYRVYTSDEPYFELPKNDPWGPAPVPTTRANTDAAAISTIRARVLSDQQNLIYGGGHGQMDGWGIETVARGYFWPDGTGYQNPDAITTVCEAIDGRYLAWKQDPTVLTASDQQWQGFGRTGLVTNLLWDEPDFQTAITKTVSSGGTAVVNPGFEIGGATAVGWQRFTWAGDGTISRDATVSHTGTASLKIVATDGNTIAGPLGHVATGPGAFTFSLWVKTDGVSTTPCIDALFWDASNNLVGADHKVFAAAGTTDWQQLSQTMTVPDGATQFEIWMMAGDGTTAWFDDIQVINNPPTGSSTVVRRDAYIDMLLSSRTYWIQNFRHYSNQAEITATGIYQANRALMLLSPGDAWPEEQAREWVREGIGMKPWLGAENPDGTRTRLLGDHYTTTTPAGLTRELGFVGSYGEVTDWLVAIWDSFTDGVNPVDAPDIKAQILKMIKARSWFRYFDIDADGNRVARLETEIGWRNEEYPGLIDYAQRVVWDSNPFQAAVAFQDPEIVGWQQEMVADGQLAPQLDLMLTNFSTRVGLNAFKFISHDLPGFQTLPASSSRLPTNWDAPDFVFTDETNGVVALKHGQELFFTEMYFRARQAVNNYARVHLVRPDGERSATIRERSQGVSSSARTFVIPDWSTWNYAINDGAGHTAGVAGGYPAPGPQIHQLLAGETLYQAPIPPDVKDPTLGADDVFGIETMLVGKAPFYQLAYGDYIIGQNTTTDKSFEFIPGGTGSATLLAETSSLRPSTGRKPRSVALNRPITVPPLSTVVLRLSGRD